MSVIHVRQIKNHLQANFVPLIQRIEGYKDQPEDYLLSCALAAYSIEQLAHANIDACVESIVDGENDNGIDAVYIDEVNCRLYVCQAKWINSGSGEPDIGSIKKFRDGIVDLVNLRFEKFNERVRDKAMKVQKALESPAYKLTIILTYTGVQGPTDLTLAEMLELLDSLNDANEIVELEVLKQTQLHRGLTVALKGPEIALDIRLASAGKIGDPYEAWYGQVSGKQIADWWEAHHEQLFSRNLRSLLTETEINLEIRNSIIESPEYFWYFNNGITLVAEKIERTLAHSASNDLAVLTCKNISVVNGAQTVGTIGRHAANPHTDLDKVIVPVRIIKVAQGEELFGRKITRSNNRQNRIENRDFVALDAEQTRIQEELAVDGVSYQLLRTGDFVPGKSAFDVYEATVSVACATGDGGLAVQVKREISKLWEDLERAPYKKLFNQSITGLYVLRCVLTQRMIDNALSQISNSSSSTVDLKGVAVHGNRLISALVFSNFKPQRFTDPDFEFEKNITSSRALELCGRYANKLQQIIDSNYAKTALPTLFKNAKKCYELIGLAQDDEDTVLKQMTLDFYGTDED